jgi:aminopeptidase-like protein
LDKKNLEINLVEIGDKMFRFMEMLYPINRSITGEGVRKTLRLIQKKIDLKIFEIPSDTQVFDWTIPNEWNIQDAYIMNSANKKILEYNKSNLHVLQYSAPIKQKISRIV